MGRELPLLIGATIAATLLLIDWLSPVGILMALGLLHPVTIFVGVGLGIVLIICTDNDWFEEHAGIHDIEILPAAARWISYVLFSVSFIILINDLSPLIAAKTGIPLDTLSVAGAGYISAALGIVYKFLPSS